MRQVIFKLDGNGDCVWIHRDKLATIRDFPMHGWTDVDFRRMAVSCRVPLCIGQKLTCRCSRGATTLIPYLGSGSRPLIDFLDGTRP